MSRTKKKNIGWSVADKAVENEAGSFSQVVDADDVQVALVDASHPHASDRNLPMIQYAPDMYHLLFRIRDARMQGAILRGRQSVHDPVVKEITQLFKLISGDDGSLALID